MNYEKAYLKLFGEVTKVIKLLEAVQRNNPHMVVTDEWVNVVALLKDIQAMGEEACIGGE